MTHTCENCHEERSAIFNDHVSGKEVCYECMTYAIELKIRFPHDFTRKEGE